jgi:hypothetical protein
MQGWKTWVGVLGLAVGGGLTAFGMTDIANIVYSFAVPMVIVGLGSKMDKILRGIATAANSAADELQKANGTMSPIAQPVAVNPTTGGPEVPKP